LISEKHHKVKKFKRYRLLSLLKKIDQGNLVQVFGEGFLAMTAVEIFDGIE
jgi:hypothetical protein